MKFDLKITTGVAAALMAGACSSQSDGWTSDRDTAICTNNQGVRVPDTNCRTGASRGGGGGYAWYYLGRNRQIPYYGDRVGGGTYARTPGTSYFHTPAGTAMTRSAAISRGGFGSSARGFGGFGE